MKIPRYPAAESSAQLNADASDHEGVEMQVVDRRGRVWWLTMMIILGNDQAFPLKLRLMF